MSELSVAGRGARTESKGAKAEPAFTLSFPRGAHQLAQDEEWVLVESRGETRKLRIQDYAEVYRVPGLYEALVQDALKCRSPERVTELLRLALDAARQDPDGLRVLDLGAGAHQGAV